MLSDREIFEIVLVRHKGLFGLDEQRLKDDLSQPQFTYISPRIRSYLDHTIRTHDFTMTDFAFATGRSFFTDREYSSYLEKLKSYLYEDGLPPNFY